MRIGRVGPAGSETVVVVTDDGLLDARAVVDDITPETLGDGALDAIAEAVSAGSLPRLAADDELRWGPPVRRPYKVLCIGLNYSDHAAESNMALPPEPVLFTKASNTVVGPDDTVLIPRGSTRTDYEVELAIVIGRTARYLSGTDDPLDYVAGYAISNDVSEREFQLERGGQWVKGKSCETFNPLGPWLVTPDEVGDPQDLALRLWVNGELRQDGTTRHMVFGVAHLVRYLSQFLVLEPGDIINTGTPAGVAFGSDSTPYLVAGDVVTLEIERLGRQQQTFEQA